MQLTLRIPAGVITNLELPVDQVTIRCLQGGDSWIEVGDELLSISGHYEVTVWGCLQGDQSEV